VPVGTAGRDADGGTEDVAVDGVEKDADEEPIEVGGGYGKANAANAAGTAGGG
jgi:hypothetical protein